MTGDNSCGHDGRDRTPGQRATPERSTTGRPTAQPTTTVTGAQLADRLLADGGFGSGFFNAVVERVGVGVGVYERDGRFAYVNQAYADLLGMDRKRLHGSPVWAVNPAVDEGRFEEYWTSFEVGETRQRETLHVRADGTEIPVETHTTAIEVDGTTYHVGTIAGISERIEGWERLERQDERLEQFASVVSHDLRNPLNVAMGRLQLAREASEAEHLDHVEQSLVRIETLIEDVLTMARDGNWIKEPEPVDVAPTAERAWRSIGATEATLSIEDDLGTVQSDENRLLEVFENLFDNAVKHTRSDVAVTVGRTDTGIYVADDGSGIPESERDDVLAYGYTTADDGTGFGLTIVEQIVTAHGWSVSLTDSVAGGVRVEFADVEFE